MTTLWISIAAVALASATIKAAGPVLVGGRELPQRAVSVIALLAPALLAALVVTETFGGDRHLVLDERSRGGGRRRRRSRAAGARAARRRPRRR